MWAGLCSRICLETPAHLKLEKVPAQRPYPQSNALPKGLGQGPALPPPQPRLIGSLPWVCGLL